MSKRIIIILSIPFIILVIATSIRGVKATSKVAGSVYEQYLAKKKDKQDPNISNRLRELPPALQDQYPVILKEPFRVTENKKDISTIQDEAMGYRLKAKNRPSQVQTALKRAGFYKKEITGKFDTETRKAIKQFQKAKSLKDDGVVGPKTWEALKLYLN